MVRLSKKTRDRSVSFKRPKAPSKKTGPLPDNLPKGYKEHVNVLTDEKSKKLFIPKISK